MKKTLVSIMVVGAISLAGCSKPVDPPTPTQSTKPSATVTAVPTPTPEVEPTTTRPEPEPTTERPTQPQETAAAPTTSGAVPPGVEFASRWGKRYPDVPEFAILKAANATCRTIEAAGNGWETDPLIQAAIETAVGAAGLNNNDALEFAQDANQNYCSSIS